MTQANTLSIDDLIKELDVGRATVKFILKRFSQWLPFDRINGDHLYSPLSIPVMFKIRDLLDGGMLPSQIEEILAKDPADKNPADSHPAGTGPGNHTPEERDIRMSKDALGFIQDLFQDIKGHQNRIARAHEKRAEAEERKAVAIEKRAEAEEKKADAMNNIAAALQEMTRQRAVDNETMEIAGQAAHALTMNEVDLSEDLPETPDSHAGINGSMEPAELTPEDLETDDFTPGGPELDDRGADDLDIDDLDLEDMFDACTEVSPGDLGGMDTEIDSIDLDDIVLDDGEPDEGLDLDDLSMLVEDQTAGELDDLSTLIDTISETDSGDGLDDLEDLLEEDFGLPEPDDDLSALVDEVPALQDTGTDDLYSLVDEGLPELDDLSALVDAPSQGPAEADLDDLSQLVDYKPEKEPPSPEARDDLDNLSLLVEPPVEEALPLDDLSLLVDSPAESTPPLDDLSLLVDSPDTDSGSGEQGDDLWALVEEGGDSQDGQPMDDLSALVDTPEAAVPSLKPDITPDQDLGKYKAAVMKIIIELKSQGLSAAETTERLNADGVATLSGKPKWAEKAITKIYGFIDSAK